MKSRLALRGAETLRFFSLVRLLTALALQMNYQRQSPALREGRRCVGRCERRGQRT